MWGGVSCPDLPLARAAGSVMSDDFLFVLPLPWPAVPLDEIGAPLGLSVSETVSASPRRPPCQAAASVVSRCLGMTLNETDKSRMVVTGF